MKRGDIVTLKPYCKDRGRAAVVLQDSKYGFTYIAFAGTAEKVEALTRNLILLNEKGNTSKT